MNYERIQFIIIVLDTELIAKVDLRHNLAILVLSSIVLKAFNSENQIFWKLRYPVPLY